MCLSMHALILAVTLKQIKIQSYLGFVECLNIALRISNLASLVLASICPSPELQPIFPPLRL